MPIDYETVAIPVVKGIDVNTRARLLPPQFLLEAINSRFTRGSGAEKRRGHVTTRVRGTTAIPVATTLPLYDRPTPVETFYTGSRSLPSNWLFGWGPLISGNRASGTGLYETSEHPDAGILFGSTSRDSEILGWNGHQLFSRVPAQTAGGALSTPTTPAVMPASRVSPIAKSSGPQTFPDAADNGTIKVVVWTGASSGYYTVLDSLSGAVLLGATAVVTITPIRVIAVGEWIHLVYKNSGSTLSVQSIHESSPLVSSARSLGECAGGYFDTHKVSETSWVVARNDGALQVWVTWLDADGSDSSTGTNSIPTLGVTPTVLNAVAIAVHPVSGGFALVFRGTAGTTRVWGSIYTAAGVTITAGIDLGAVTSATRAVAVAPKYIYNASGVATYEAYYDDTSTGNPTVCKRFATAVLRTSTRYYARLASQAFRVGDRTFVWAGSESTLQSTWFLLDEGLAPVGHQDYATANVPASGSFPALAAVNWMSTTVKDTCVFHCALGYKVRVASETQTVGTNVPAVYAEPSIKYTVLDFLPRLRSAQAGRSTYFAGSQLWAYDGAELTESGFHLAPEGVTTEEAPSGALETTGEYIWRVDLCYRNAQNEEIRSNTFYTTALTLTGSNKTATITIPTVITRRSNSYFLIYRNANAGTQWYLVNSRDPSSALFKTNDQTASTVSFSDAGAVTDALLISREQHPGNGGFNYLNPIAAPACEVIASGRDRLWVAGGELPAGQVAPSRLFEPGDTPSFHPLVNIQIDRNTEAVTAIGFVGDAAIIFRRNHAYVQTGDGPDNVMNGTWDSSRLAFSDVGAVGQESIALISDGLLFQSPAGVRLIAPGGGLKSVGGPVDNVVKDLDIAATVVVGEDQEVRFYARTGDTYVYNYQYDCWSTWTLNAVGVSRDVTTGLAVLASADGYLWAETDDVWLDNGAVYKQRIRFAWLRAGSLMDYQRVRRIGAIGEWDGITEHDVHVEVFYDEREFYEESFDWTMPTDAASPSWNTDTFGNGLFGDGTFGDNDAGE